MTSSYLHPSDASASGLLSLHFSFQPISQFILIGGEVLQWEIFLALAVCVCLSIGAVNFEPFELGP